MTNEMIVKQTGEVVDLKNPVNVFGTDSPQGIITRAQSIADVLVPIVEKRKLYKEIGGKKHVYVEGWSNMISLLGVFPHVISSIRIEREDEILYEAKVVLRTLNGQEVGAGEAICSSRERNWSGRDEYTIKSMAQTRAVGKACRLSFAWLIGLAGYEATPVEEMPEDKPFVKMPQEKVEAEHPNVEKAQQAMAGMASDKQRKMIFAKCRSAGISEDDLKKFLWDNFKIESTKDLRWQDIDKVVKFIDHEPTAQA